MNNESEIQTISLAAFEAQAERYARIIRGLIVSWTLSIALLSAALICLIH